MKVSEDIKTFLLRNHKREKRGSETSYSCLCYHPLHNFLLLLSLRIHCFCFVNIQYPTTYMYNRIEVIDTICCLTEDIPKIFIKTCSLNSHVCF